MPLKGVLFSRQELNIARPQDPERFVMEDALTELLDMTGCGGGGDTGSTGNTEIGRAHV